MFEATKICLDVLTPGHPPLEFNTLQARAELEAACELYAAIRKYVDSREPIGQGYGQRVLDALRACESIEIGKGGR